MATTTVDPYKAYADLYKKRTDAITAQTKQAETERANREQQAQTTLANANRGVYATYKNAINPYGRFASQNNFSQGVSDYYNNASYGTMLKGIGTNQFNYNDAMNNSNTLWQNYLAQKAGNEADALNDYNTALVAQQKYDKEQEIAEQERAEAIRQYELNLKLQQDQLARQREADAATQKRWEAEQAEEKRRWDLQWEAQKNASSGSGSSSGGGSSYTKSATPATPVALSPATDNVSRTKMYGDVNDNKVAKTETKNGYVISYNKYGNVVSKKKASSTNNSKRKQYTAYDKSAKRNITYNTGFAKGIF